MGGRTLLLMMLGTVLGAAAADEALGAILGLLIGWLVGDHFNLRERLARLEERPAPSAANRFQTPAPRPPASAPVPEPLPEPAPLAPRPVSQPAPESWEPRPTPEPQTAPQTAALLAWLLGGNPLARIGLLLLFFGVAFLLKFVTQTYSLPLELRFMGTSLLGLVLLGVGWRLRERRPAYAMLVQGGGIGVLYLTLFVATRVGLVPSELAFPLLVAIGLLAALLALWQDAQALALFGTLGGFLAPVLASTGGGNHVQLFSFYALLNAGVLGLAWYKSWRTLNLAGFVFTFVIGALWGYRYYRPEFLTTTEPFLILFFLMYLAISVLFALRQPPRLKGYVDGALVFGLPIIAFALQAGLVRELEFGLAWSAALLGGFYLVLASLLWLRQGQGLRLLCEAFLALGIVFATLAIPLASDARWTAAAWALEGAALVWVGVRQERRLARLSGLALQLLAGGAFVQGWHPPWVEAQMLPAIWPVLNGRYLGGLLISLAGLISAGWLGRQTAPRPWESATGWLILVWGLLWWYASGGQELERWFSGTGLTHAWLLFLAASAALALLLRRPLDWCFLGIPVLLLVPAALLALAGAWAGHWLAPWALVFWMPGAGLDTLLAHGPNHPFAGVGLLAWSALFGMHLLGLQRLDADFPSERWRRAWHGAGLWPLAWVLAWEGAWWLNQASQGQGAWALAGWGALPAILILVLLQPGPRLAPWPLARHRAAYLGTGIGPLLAFGGLWSLTANLESSGAAQPLPYLPLLNPLDLAMLLMGLALVRWWLALGAEQPNLAARRGRMIRILGAAAGFVWLNALVARSVHHWDGVPFLWHRLFASTSFQTSISLLWSSLALVLMAWSARRAIRTWWMAGAGLLALVVAKLFLIELGNAGTLARVVSFLGVGALLLVIGYLAPLPPKAKN